MTSDAKVSGKQRLNKEEILAKYQERAVLDNGHTVIRIPIKGNRTTTVFANEVANMAQRISRIINEPIATVVWDGTTKTGAYIEIKTLGRATDVLAYLAAIGLGVVDVVHAEALLEWGNEVLRGAQIGEPCLDGSELPETAEGEISDVQTYEHAPDAAELELMATEATLPAMPDGYVELEPGEMVAASCRMLTDSGWIPVTSMHLGRTVEAGERYIKPATQQ